MEKSFDLGSIMKRHQNKHKNRPDQFKSVARGTQRRMENSLRLRKSKRLSHFDNARNLAQTSPVTEAKSKADKRRLQLQKWKEEKERKKQESVAKKTKPFITGVPHNPLKYVPPPPVKVVPSTSGCVTRSQAAKIQKEQSNKIQQKQQSFAPNNAVFRAPQIRTLTQISFKKKNEPSKTNIQPIVSTTATVTTRAQTYRGLFAESRARADRSFKTSQIVKPVRKPNINSKLVSSSSSENESLTQSTKSTSSGDVDLTVRMISSSESNINSCTETNSSKSLQSTSSCEFESEMQLTINQKSNKSLSMAKTKNVPTHISSQMSNQVEHKLFTPKNHVPKSESSSEERLRSPKSPVNLPMTPEQLAEEFKKISPCVTLSRGKDNARREMKKKIDEGLLDDDVNDMDSVEHFERQLASEIKRLTEICDVWDKVFEQVSLPETVQELVLSAVGQARLLMSQKMQQFAQLVGRCARPEPGAPLVTAADLRGFWDMVFLQVENVDMRFKELEELRARNWVEKSAAVKAAGRKPRSRAAPPPARPHAATSRLRDVIAAARRAKSSQVSVSVQRSDTELSQEERTFDAGFFTVHSPVRSPHAPATPRNKPNLLKAVLSSEAEKASASKKAASFAMLRASVLGKNIDCEGVEPLPQTPVQQINIQATPGRSILKQPNETTAKSVKHVKVVLFNQSDSEMNTSTEDIILPTEQKDKTTTEMPESAANSEENIRNTDCTVNIENANKMESVSTLIEIKENEPNKTEKRSSRRQSRLTRQDALKTEQHAPVTRKMQKYMDAVLDSMDAKTPQNKEAVEKKTPKRSARKKVQAEKENMDKTEDMKQMEQKIEYTPRPRRSCRKNVVPS